MRRLQRKIMRAAFAVTAHTAMCVAALCVAQQQPAANTNRVRSSQFRSEQWTDRASAYEQLRSDPAALDNPKAQQALLELLDRENRLIETTLRDSHEQVGVSAKYGEQYGEYVSQLGETVDSFADWNDSHQVCIFVHRSYNPESQFAAKIASHGKVAIPCLVEMYHSDVSLTRAEAAPVLVQALSKAKGQLDAKTAQIARRAVLQALRDPKEVVRINTVEALGDVGGEDMIPALKEVVEKDNSPDVSGHSIRKRAAEAIAAIQKRVGQQQN